MDDRRKKLQFRAWRRGFREIDLILGGFADRYLANLPEKGVDEFEALMNVPDPDVYDWITAGVTAPPDYETETLALIRAYQFEVHASRKA